MRVRHWDETLDGPMSEAVMRRKLEAAGYLVSRQAYAPGTSFPEHSHAMDKIDAVISGRFRMIVAGHFAILGPGDWVEIPRGVHHSAAVVGGEPVISLDAARVPALEN
jgi:quercetin dioxygenase-like cupin family protein